MNSDLTQNIISGRLEDTQAQTSVAMNSGEDGNTERSNVFDGKRGHFNHILSKIISMVYYEVAALNSGFKLHHVTLNFEREISGLYYTTGFEK